uniref:Uncharacterized protein n=1 Tax=Panagrellus redivivus TaxID=6233 RepID=A0A7E4VE42_PANRE
MSTSITGRAQSASIANELLKVLGDAATTITAVPQPRACRFFDEEKEDVGDRGAGEAWNTFDQTFFKSIERRKEDQILNIISNAFNSQGVG